MLGSNAPREKMGFDFRFLVFPPFFFLCVYFVFNTEYDVRQTGGVVGKVKDEEAAAAVLASGRRARIESKRCWTFSRSVRFGADPAREGVWRRNWAGPSTTQQPAKCGLEGEKNQVRGDAETMLGLKSRRSAYTDERR